ncbi:MAG TPA: hypothetical protein VNF68_02055 [Candidatus Baltobacteraceae bacterium]|nr:hypothetical protein [Candidatus Baltobacteraceae bacterium]
MAEYLKMYPNIAVSPVRAGSVEVDVVHAIVDDDSDTVRKHDALLLHWLAPSRLFPSLEALLTVRPHAPGTIVRLTGRYTPPYGLAGMLFDLVVGRIIATLTLRRLLTRLVKQVEHQFERRRAVSTLD